jgi:hypothetical protein
MKRLVVLSLFLLVTTVACAQQPEDTGSADSGVVAKFGDQSISSAELDELVKAKVVALRQQEYDIKRQQLEQTIFERLPRKRRNPPKSRSSRFSTNIVRG